MDGPHACHTKWSKSDREREISHGIPYMQNLQRNDTNDTNAESSNKWYKWIYKTETDMQT